MGRHGGLGAHAREHQPGRRQAGHRQQPGADRGRGLPVHRRDAAAPGAQDLAAAGRAPTRFGRRHGRGAPRPRDHPGPGTARPAAWTARHRRCGRSAAAADPGLGRPDDGRLDRRERLQRAAPGADPTRGRAQRPARGQPEPPRPSAARHPGRQPAMVGAARAAAVRRPRAAARRELGRAAAAGAGDLRSAARDLEPGLGAGAPAAAGPCAVSAVPSPG